MAKSKLVPSVLLLLVVGMSALLWLSEPSPAPDASTPTAASAARPPEPPAHAAMNWSIDFSAWDQRIGDLSKALSDLVPHSDEQHWALLRALGPKAPTVSLQALRAQAESAPSLPGAGAEPEVALRAALLAAESPPNPAPPVPPGGRGASPLPAGKASRADATTLAWRLELLGLLIVRERRDDLRKPLAQHLERAVRLLLYPRSTTDAPLLSLAQAVFRAAPIVGNSRDEPDIRRVFGTLSQRPENTGSGLLLAAKRLEAQASFIQSQPAHPALLRALEASAKQVLHQLQAQKQLDLTVPGQLENAVSALRALRLGRSVAETAGAP